MSQQNVRLMSSALDAFNKREGRSFDALLADDVEIVPVRAAMEGVVFRGPEAGSRYCRAVEDAWQDLTWIVEEIRDGGSWTIALGRIRGRGRTSDAMIDARGAWVASFRDGLITRFQTYSDREAALKAVGLEE